MTISGKHIVEGGLIVAPTTLPKVQAWGLFAEKGFKKGDHIIFYTGKIIREKGHKVTAYTFQHPNIEEASIEPSEEFLVDPNKYANHQSPFIPVIKNHLGTLFPTREPNPKWNAEVAYHEDDEKSVSLVASRDILPGEEIFFDYGTDYEYTQEMYDVEQFWWALHTGPAILQA